MTLSIVSVALMSLSIQTAMSGPVQQRGAEKSRASKGMERNFDETLFFVVVEHRKRRLGGFERNRFP